MSKLCKLTYIYLYYWQIYKFRSQWEINSHSEIGIRNLKTLAPVSVDEDMEQQDLSQTAGGSENRYSIFWEINLSEDSNIENLYLYIPEVSSIVQFRNTLMLCA